MALVPLVQKHQNATPFPTSFHHSKHPMHSKKMIQMALQSHITKRTALTNIAAAAATSIICSNQTAVAFDFRITVPEQTLEEAESGIKGHAQSLLKVKELLEAESWKAAQKALRKSSAYLKQDIYTIIQAKPGIERPELRKLYFNLFYSVTRLDYAARDKDVPRIWEYYDNVVVALNNILSRI